jgi:hypothetical protein|tara:strand:- start:12 stop:875 length:864 start_codon:yes stop_codon:yes gene_type:complete
MIDKRMMYSQGQRVAKTLDGSRPGYAGPAGGASAGGNYGGDSSGGVGANEMSGAGPSNTGGNKSDARDRAISNQYKNMPTPTVTVGEDKFGNPITFKTTYTERRNRQKNLDALNKQGISSFDPRVIKKGFNFLDPRNLVTNFAPQPKNPFSFKNIATNIILGIVAPQLLGPKFATGMKAYNIAKTASKFAKDINLTDKNVLESFTDNLKSNFSNESSDLGKGKKSTTQSSIDEDLSKIGNGDGGLESLANVDSLNQEYLLLLNKFNSGNFTDSDQVRFTLLKNMLGK